ncbi:MAG: hypothetical protein C5B52_15380 [Bacteroidetes bacterium]|nr:MAG: hypothetical protein C5B52_15380 [Bacteroidota bacterium]
MPTGRRRFTVEEKQEILHQAKQIGITNALRKHNLSYSVFHRWKSNMTDKSKESSKAKNYQGLGQRVKELMEENALLKKIIANQTMLLEMKEEELRRSK